MGGTFNLETVERKNKKLQKHEYLENKKSLFDEIKTIFHIFDILFLVKLEK